MTKVRKIVRHICCVRCFLRMESKDGQDARDMAKEAGWQTYPITNVSHPWLCAECCKNDEGSRNCDPSKTQPLTESAQTVRAQDGVRGE